MSQEKTQADHEPNHEQDEESKNLTQDEVNRIVNSAISSRLKSFEKKMDQMFTSLTSPSQESSQSSSSDETKFNKNEFLKLKSEFNRLKEEKEKERQSYKLNQLDSTLTETLVNLGVASHFIKPAKALLKQEGMVSYSEEDDDQVIFKKSSFETADLQTGLRDWLKSDEGKHFLPASNLKGSGDKSYKSNGSHTDPKAKAEERLVNLLLNKNF